MKSYTITSRASVDMGIYQGETPAHALAALHRDAGYQVSVDEHDELVFKDDEEREICGDVDDWIIEEVSEKEE